MIYEQLLLEMIFSDVEHFFFLKERNFIFDAKFSKWLSCTRTIADVKVVLKACFNKFNVAMPRIEHDKGDKLGKFANII